MTMSNDKRDATFHRGTARIGPDPLDTVNLWGMAPPDPATDRTAYRRPGRPPWADKRRLPAWAWVSLVLGGLLIVCGSSAAVALFDQNGPVPAISTSPALAAVSVTGTCEKKLVGEYGLVATVRATNSTERPQTGVVWVRWPLTGEAAQEFTKRVTLAPGEGVDFPVNQEVPAERWYRAGACTFGWTGS
jgi:hypothetical protein